MNAIPKTRSSEYDFAEQMMELPDFVCEAITEEADFPALIRGLQSRDAIGVMEEVISACHKYADFLLDKLEYDQTYSERMKQLQEIYS